MVKRKPHNGEAQLDDLAEGLERMDRDSGGGQEGSTEGLSTVPEADAAKVEELAANDQALKADAGAGGEDAADHPERGTDARDEHGRPDDIPPKRGSE